MRRNLVPALVILVAFIWIVAGLVQAQIDPIAVGTVKTYQSATQTNRNASASYAIVPVAGRARLIISIAETGKELTAAIGTTTVVVQAGHVITFNNPLDLDLDAGIPVGIIGSETVKHTIIQLKY